MNDFKRLQSGCVLFGLPWIGVALALAVIFIRANLALGAEPPGAIRVAPGMHVAETAPEPHVTSEAGFADTGPETASGQPADGISQANTAVQPEPRPGTAVPVSSEPTGMSGQDVAAAPEKNKRELFVITLVGDTGLNASNQPVRPDRALRQGRGYKWAWTTKYIAPLIDGQLNIANIETVITGRNDLKSVPKAFNFRMHPNGARHLVDVGFNVFSLANNHAADYGRDGVKDTLLHADKLRLAGLRAFAGVGRDRDEAVQSKTFSIGSARFGFAAMGIGARAPGVARAGQGRAGQVNIYSDKDFGDVVDGLAASRSDYRILSLHFGVERNVFPPQGQIRKWRDDVLLGRGIDLIFGHHPHVVQGVQITDGKLIFYGLGNFLHMGMQDMGKYNACRDYGLLARVFVVREADGTMAAQAVQVIPLTDMHVQAKPMTGKAAGRRIDILNALATKLDDGAVGSRGVRFAKQVDGSGLFCAAGAEDAPGRLGVLCQGYEPARPLTSPERRRFLGFCGAVSRVSTRSRARKRHQASRKPRKAWTGQGALSKQ